MDTLELSFPFSSLIVCHILEIDWCELVHFVHENTRVHAYCVDTLDTRFSPFPANL